MKNFKLKYFIILPLILAGCGVSVKLYNKVATDPNVTTKKLSIIAPFVAVNFPVKETFIQGKSDTTVLHDTTIETNVVYDTITKQIDSIKIKKVVQNHYILRTDTIKVKEAVDCFTINNKLIQAETKINELKAKEQKILYFVIFLIILLFIIVWLKFKKW